MHQLCRFDNDEERLRFIPNKRGKIAKQLINDNEVNFAFNSKIFFYILALWNAAKEGNLDVVRRLVTLKHDINERTNVNGWTPLHLVTKYLSFKGSCLKELFGCEIFDG